MTKEDLTLPTAHSDLAFEINSFYNMGRAKATEAANSQLLETYWSIGHSIVHSKMKGHSKTKNGTSLFENLSKDLYPKHGNGFTASNLRIIRKFYLAYPNRGAFSGLLSWSHYVELLKIRDKEERLFYKMESEIKRWSVRELRRQKKASLYSRLDETQRKLFILQRTLPGQQMQMPEDLLRDIHMLEFLRVAEP